MGYDYSFDQKTDDDYFRLNIFGGSRYAGYMVDLGMGFDAGNYPEFPDAGQFDLTDDEAYEDVPLADDKSEARKRLEAATEEVRTWHGPEIPGIPTHKVAGSNDGWHILPAECKAALRIYEALEPARIAEVIPAEARDYWDQWIDYIRRAIDYNGFRTY